MERDLKPARHPGRTLPSQERLPNSPEAKDCLLSEGTTTAQEQTFFSFSRATAVASKAWSPRVCRPLASPGRHEARTALGGCPLRSSPPSKASCPPTPELAHKLFQMRTGLGLILGSRAPSVTRLPRTALFSTPLTTLVTSKHPWHVCDRLWLPLRYFKLCSSAVSGPALKRTFIATSQSQTRWSLISKLLCSLVEGQEERKAKSQRRKPGGQKPLSSSRGAAGLAAGGQGSVPAGQAPWAQATTEPPPASASSPVTTAWGKAEGGCAGQMHSRGTQNRAGTCIRMHGVSLLRPGRGTTRQHHSVPPCLSL